MPHEEARDLIRQTLPSADPHERLLVQIIGWLESNYGRGWKGAGVGSHNWGAITGSYKGDSFTYGDSRPNPDDPDHPIKYETKFRKYPNHAEGIADLHNLLTSSYYPSIEAARNNDWEQVSQAMYDGGYYTGTHPDPAVNVARHRKRVLQIHEKLAPLYESDSPPFVIPQPDLPPLPTGEQPKRRLRMWPALAFPLLSLAIAWAKYRRRA